MVEWKCNRLDKLYCKNMIIIDILIVKIDGKFQRQNCTKNTDSKVYINYNRNIFIDQMNY